ncbi:MAG: flavodoxin [Bacteroidales bacterium]|nr:flavodoxin [Bacteroidales bacterium]
MEKIGIFYGSTSGSTKSVAEKLQKIFGKKAEVHDIKHADNELIEKYTNLIFGTSAWGIGDMQDDWEMFVDNLSDINFTGKKLALFGMGDQEEYPESFVDGLGTLYCRLPDKTIVVGTSDTDGYKYYFSLADNNGKFVGLALDVHSQDNLTDERLKHWAKQLESEFV